MRAALLALVLAAPLPLLAQAPDRPTEPPIDIAEFEAIATGQTMIWATPNGPYGLEQYFPDRRVGWRRRDEPCRYGEYYMIDQMICFQYDEDGIDHCWTMWRDGDGFTAELREDIGPLTSITATPDSLNCPVPYIGVRY